MHLLQRRNFLRGLGIGAGGTLLGSMMRTILPEALGAEPSRRRYVQYFYGWGIQEARFKHTPRSETDFDLREIFAPLEPFKSQVVVFEYLKNGGGGSLHGNQNVMCGIDASKGFPSGQSIDRYLAKKIAAEDPIPSMNFIYHTRNGPGAHVSADGSGVPFPAEWNPIRAFSTIFGGAAAGKAPAPATMMAETQALLSRDKSVLDNIASDITRLSGRVSASERAKLDQYLGSLRALERQLGNLYQNQASCTAGAPPRFDGAAWYPAGKPFDFQFTDQFYPEVARAFMDVTFNALACGLSRFGSYTVATKSGSNSYGLYFPSSLVQHPNPQHHTLCHEGNSAALTRIDRYHSGEVAYLAGKLRGLREGDGTMLDNTVLLLGNIGGGHHEPTLDKHSVYVLVGNAGHALKTGRIFTFGRNERYTNDLCLTIAHAMGAPANAFGDPAQCKGPLPILA